MEEQSPARKQLARDAKREALTRQEDAARTLADFEGVVKTWNGLDKNRSRRERRHEIGRPNAEMLHWDKMNANDEKGEMKSGLDVVTPRPLEHEWWRQLLRGDFIDVIYDCPHEMHELTSSRTMSNLLKTLNENQCEVMYHWVIRQYSAQRIAKFRNQTDRNIRKVYETLLGGLRDKLHLWISPRYDEDLPLTLAQKQFVEDYRSGVFKKKAALDEKNSK